MDGFDFEISKSDLQSIPEIIIDEQDLAKAASQVLEVTSEDLRAASKLLQAGELEFLNLTLDDIRNAQPELIEIGLNDLPPIIEITLADLPRDMTGATVDCFHGTSYEYAKQIKRQGFRVGSGAAFGSGIYFSIGGISIARSYAKSAKPCIIQARVQWGRVAYLDDPNLPAHIRGSGDKATKAAMKAGFNSFIQATKYSAKKPTVGIVLATKGKYVRPPRIEIVKLLDPKGKVIG